MQTNAAIRIAPIEKIFLDAEQIVERMIVLTRGYPDDLRLDRLLAKRLPPPPECPHSDERHLYCLMLLPPAGSPALDFERHWKTLCCSRKDTWVWPDLRFGEGELVPHTTNQHRPESYSWAIVELGRANQGKCACDAEKEIELRGFQPLGPELPLIAAVHEEWADSIDGRKFPFVYASGLEIYFGRSKDQRFAMHLGRQPCCPKLALQVETTKTLCSYLGTGSIRY